MRIREGNLIISGIVPKPTPIWPFFEKGAIDTYPNYNDRYMDYTYTFSDYCTWSLLIFFKGGWRTLLDPRAIQWLPLKLAIIGIFLETVFRELRKH